MSRGVPWPCALLILTVFAPLLALVTWNLFGLSCFESLRPTSSEGLETKVHPTTTITGRVPCEEIQEKNDELQSALRGCEPMSVDEDLARSDLLPEWLEETLPTANLAIYYSGIGNGGVASIKNELLNAMWIARNWNLTVLLDDESPNFIHLRTAYDIPLMRHLQVKEFGSTFVWKKELKNIASRDVPLPHQCTQLNVYFRERPDQTIHDMIAGTGRVNTFLSDPKWTKNPYRCINFPVLDGEAQWIPENTRCQNYKDCRDLTNSFKWSKPVYQEAARVKKKIARLTGGKGYACIHANSWWCKQNMFLKPVPKEQNDACMTSWFASALCDTELLPDVQNVLLVGQDDVESVPILKPLLQKVLPNGKEANVFTLGDVGDIAPIGKKGFARFKSNLAKPEACYALRAAVSSMLCSPGYASSYLGEPFSGFTIGLTMNPAYYPDVEIKDWSVLIYSPVGKLVSSWLPKAPWNSFSPEKWVDHIVGASIGKVPPWLRHTRTEVCG
eukprot:TRINITY_DN47907_c0_g1_i1.p1 TRINITY_DN47907_c0_g1~~TRINITY_DN47907_c0_g1_i1.p1  ORF type:complete len:547 (-),score=45.80 TRINITY_DN47907_c0_g1_i1:168-1670(-)